MGARGSETIPRKKTSAPARLFDANPVRIEGGASQTLGQFDYLNRSDRPEAQAVRSFFEDCLTRYPQSGRSRLIGSFRSRDQTPHFAAAFELVVHELLIRAGAKVLAVDGAVANGTAPDFFVKLANGDKLYVEATLATGVTAEVIGAEKRMAEVIDAIDDVMSADFFWDVSYRGTPSAPVRRRDLKAKLQTWAATLNYDALVATESRDRLPSLLHDEHGLSLRIRPRPRRRTRGQPSRSLGVVMPEAYWGDSREPVRVRALEKANKYGELDYPLVVAVNTFAGFVGWSELAEVLFGDIAVAINTETDEVRETRSDNGIYWDGQGWINPRLDALIVFSDLHPWTLGQRTSVRMIHPHKHPKGILVPLPGSELVLSGQKLESVPGSWIREVLGLHAGWPEGA